MAHRRGPSARILIAGDADDLPMIRHLLGHLAADAYGQILIEALGEDDVVPLDAPARVTVSWLLRSRRASRVPALVFAERGEPLAQALSAWAREWMPGAPDDETSLIWIGAEGCERVGALVERLQHDIAHAAGER